MATDDQAAIRQELRSLAEQYARGVDRHDDVDGFVALFHADAVINIYDPSDTAEPRVVRGERLARIPEVIQRYDVGYCTHQRMNTVVLNRDVGLHLACRVHNQGCESLPTLAIKTVGLDILLDQALEAQRIA